MKEVACFMVRNQYPNGNIYWHGFVSRRMAEEFSEPFRDLNTDSAIFFGVAQMDAVQVQQCSHPKGCVFNPEQILKFEEV